MPYTEYFRGYAGKRHAIFRVLEGAGVITISVASIIATDGAATPFVVASFTSAVSMASATSDYFEYSEIYDAAKDGVALSSGHNFMRDYLFGGNEKLYRNTMQVNSTITSVALLFTGLKTIKANSIGKCDLVFTAGQDILVPIAASKITDKGLDYAAERLNMNEYIRETLKFSVDTYMTYKITQVGKTGNANGEVVKSIEGEPVSKPVSEIPESSGINVGEGGSGSDYSGEEWYDYFVNKYGKENVQGSFFKEINYEPTSGIKFTTHEGKTTTILGRYDMDTKAIFSETGNIKSISYDGHDGGFNLLNVPDKLSNAKGVDFWNDYNVPFLDEAIGRKDIIQLATEPNKASMFRINVETGLIERSGFGREILYLEEHGYKFDKTLMQMVPLN